MSMKFTVFLILCVLFFFAGSIYAYSLNDTPILLIGVALTATTFVVLVNHLGWIRP